MQSSSKQWIHLHGMTLSYKLLHPESCFAITPCSFTENESI